MRALLDLTDAEYLRRFRRTNLCVGGWDAELARAAAAKLVARESRLVVLGARVSAAIGVSYSPFEQFAVEKCKVLVLPHPSGKCRAWNDPAASERARSSVLSFDEEGA